ncbi:MAG: AI-2E family transporter, partial [Betaproteobacteria bacterium]
MTPATEETASRGSLARYTYQVLIAVAIAAAVVVLWRISSVVMMIFGAVLLATALRTLMRTIVRVTGLGERPSFAIAVLLIIAVLGLTGWLVGGQVSGQLGDLEKVLPDAIQKAKGWLQQSSIGNTIVQSTGAIKDNAGGAVSGVAHFATSTLGALTDVIFIIFVGLYLAADPGLHRRGLARLLPVAARAPTIAAMEAAGVGLRKWLLGQVIAMVSVGIFAFAGLSLLGIPLAMPLALITALLEFIPFIGPIISAIPAILMGFTLGPTDALYVGLLYLAMHQLEGNVLMPLIQKWAVELPPALGITAVIVFGLLFGLLGVLFAVPLMVALMILVQKLYVERALESKPAT